MNTPNKLSLTRICLVPLMVLLWYIGGDVCRIISAVVFAAASFTDYLDGHIARKNQIITDFGKFIDPLADKTLVLSALILLASSGIFPAWCVILILARELAVDGLRMIAVTKGQVIAAGKLGKIKTCSQIACVLWLMLTLQPSFSHVVSAVLTVWILIITLWSGIDYFIRNGACLKETR